MSFDRIGPYGLNRTDLVLASVMISFRFGPTKLKIRVGIYFALAFAFAAWGFSIGQYWPSIAAVFWLLWIIVLGPGMRSLKRSHDIYLSYDPEGIAADTPNARTVYKWATIGKFGFVGTRLFVMITDNCALVLSERITDRANLERVAASVRSGVAGLTATSG